MPLASIPILDPASCRARQETLRNYLAEQNLDAALLVNRHYVHALTGYWHEQPLTLAAVLVPREGKVVVCAPGEDLDAPAADDHITYEPQELCTLVEDIPARLGAAIGPALTSHLRIATTGEVLTSLSDTAKWVDISCAYQVLRRKKDPDEIAFLRFCIEATDAAYTEARRLLAPGVTEVEIFAAMHAAAVNAVGEPLSGWGNDFRSAAPGGFPRQRPAAAGEIAVLDIGVGVRGYRSDLCRSFAVDRSPTDAQIAAHARARKALDHAENNMLPGKSCKTLYEEIHAMLGGWNGYSFFHHLGHGIGLDPHEVPRLNPNRDDTFEAGDVVAVEPGLYGEDLHAGLRLEQNYLVTENGPERLSSFPLDL